MPRVRFIHSSREDLPRVIEQGGKPADLYCNIDTGYLYIVDKEEQMERVSSGCLYMRDGEGRFIPFFQVESGEIKMKTEEGLEKIDSKIEKRKDNEWYKDFPLLEGVFKEYGKN